MKHSALQLITVALLLCGCSGNIPTSSGNGQKGNMIEISDWENFSIKSKVLFKEHIVRDDKSVALTTYSTKTTLRNNDDFSIHLYNNLSKPCSPAITGASESISIEEGSHWGKVDFFEKYGSEGGVIDYAGERPLCAQPGSAAHRYAFCSEKDGKTVVICISQMTDNPELAEEIFSTFRWTE